MLLASFNPFVYEPLGHCSPSLSAFLSRGSRDLLFRSLRGSLLSWCPHTETVFCWPHTCALSTWLSVMAVGGPSPCSKAKGTKCCRLVAILYPFTAQPHFYPHLGLTRNLTSFHDGTWQQSRVVSGGCVLESYWVPLLSPFSRLGKEASKKQEGRAKTRAGTAGSGELSAVRMCSLSRLMGLRKHAGMGSVLGLFTDNCFSSLRGSQKRTVLHAKMKQY